MPSIPLHPHASSSPFHLHNPLPQILQTPSGLAVLELQGTINLPSLDDQGAVPHPANAEDPDVDPGITAFETPIGKLMFPDYSPQTTSPDDTKWMKRVYLYVGRYQRMTGEVKKLAQPLALVQKRKKHSHSDGERIAESKGEELEIVEIIKYKLLFKNRPEPVNDMFESYEGTLVLSQENREVSGHLAAMAYRMALEIRGFATGGADVLPKTESR